MQGGTETENGNERGERGMGDTEREMGRGDDTIGTREIERGIGGGREMEMENRGILMIRESIRRRSARRMSMLVLLTDMYQRVVLDLVVGLGSLTRKGRGDEGRGRQYPTSESHLGRKHVYKDR